MAVAGLDEQRLKQMAISLWRRGGMDSLVKVAPRGRSPNDVLNIGYCTTFKYVVGRTPAEMEAVVGLRIGSKLAGGASIFLVRPLPGPDTIPFERLYADAGRNSTAIKTAHPDYPPGLGSAPMGIGWAFATGASLSWRKSRQGKNSPTRSLNCLRQSKFSERSERSRIRRWLHAAL